MLPHYLVKYLYTPKIAVLKDWAMQAAMQD